MKRVVVTGIGLVTPCGVGTRETWGAILAGRSGIGPITHFDASRHPTRIAGEVKGFDASRWIERRRAREMDPFIWFAVVAAQMAVDDAGLDFSKEALERCGTVIGAGLGGLRTLEATHSLLLSKGPRPVSPYFIPKLIANLAPAQVSMRFGLRGPNVCTVTACASGGHAIGDSLHWIRRGAVDIMLAGGSEATVTPLGVAGFNAMRALSTRNDEPERASRPFDKGRDGFVVAEGAGILVLEELEHAKRRGARIYAELLGYGATADAHHLTQPAPEGEGAQRSMREALKDAGIASERVDHINAHGTSTPIGDVIETVAIKKVFASHAKRLAVSSTKSMTGHTLGAAGGIETAFCALAVGEGKVPPTVNLEEPDPSCDLDYVPNVARDAKVRVAMTNSFGFGGTNATLVLGRYE